MPRAAAGAICGEHGPRGPMTWAPAFVPEARLRHDAGVTVVSGAPGLPHLTSFPRRREARSHCNAGARAAEMPRAAAGAICGENGPRGPMTWAPAFAGVTFVERDARERLTIAVKSKPIIQH